MSLKRVEYRFKYYLHFLHVRKKITSTTKVTDELPEEKLLNWYRLNKIQENVRTKYPNIPTSLNVDKLMIEDKIISYDQLKKKLSTKQAYTIPRREKNR